MSVAAVRWVLDHADVKNPAELAVLVSIAERANEQNTCWPGVADIARRSRQSPRTVYRILRKLEERGLIQRKQRRYQSSIFIISGVTPVSVRIDTSESIVSDTAVADRTQNLTIIEPRKRRQPDSRGKVAGEVKRKPRHGQRTRDGKRIWLDAGTDDFQAYLAHNGQTPLLWNNSGAWFSYF